MTKFKIIIFTIILTLISLGCQTNQLVIKMYQLEMAFSISPLVYICDYPEKQESEKLVLEMTRITNYLDNKYNPNKQSSLLSQVNASAGKNPVNVDLEFLEIIEKAIQIGEEGKVNDSVLYDITILPIVELWDFPNKYFPIHGTQNIPTKQDIDSHLHLVNYQKIVINRDNMTIFLQDEKMKIDLGSILKGYATDLLKNYLTEQGYQNFIIDVGGNILVHGSNLKDSRPWVVGIKEPYSLGNTIGNITSDDYKQTFVTSGIYERYIKDINNHNYHHLLNPMTGYPLDNDLIAVTIITQNSMLADAYSTAVFMMGLNQGLAFVNNHNELEAVFITTNKNIIISEGLINNFQLNEDIIERGYQF